MKCLIHLWKEGIITLLHLSFIEAIFETFAIPHRKGQYNVPHMTQTYSNKGDSNVIGPNVVQSDSVPLLLRTCMSYL